MSIFPLPVYEADADPHNRDSMTDEERWASMEPPSTLVVKFGAMKLIAELPYSGDVKPGCGTKLVARTFRGTELVEMLTTTCENAGCNKSITRKEMLEYIENSGGKDYPFHTEGQVLRVATIEDMNRATELANMKRDWVKTVKRAVAERDLRMKIVEVEPILGEEVLTVYFMAEERVDFRDLVRHLASEFSTRIEMRQVGARDEARLVADYERCGQHCCCKNFLKVLKPVSMRAAKTQKATLDPLKISGRCGRLMCCLRYEDQTYRELKKNLPNRKSRVGTPYGPGLVLDGKILAQLVLVRLEHNNEEVAVPVESLTDPETCPQPAQMSPEQRAAFDAAIARGVEDPMRGLEEAAIEEKADEQQRARRGRKRSKDEQQDAYREKSKSTEDDSAEGGKKSKRRRRRRGKAKGKGKANGAPSRNQGAGPTGEAGPGKPKKKRRRRRGKRKGKGGGGEGGQSGGGT